MPVKICEKLPFKLKVSAKKRLKNSGKVAGYSKIFKLRCVFAKQWNCFLFHWADRWPKDLATLVTVYCLSLLPDSWKFGQITQTGPQKSPLQKKIHYLARIGRTETGKFNCNNLLEKPYNCFFLKFFIGSVLIIIIFSKLFLAWNVDLTLYRVGCRIFSNSSATLAGKL
jgi:hypothetical protein